MSNRLGVVVIGRNEGDRLIHCINSIRGDFKVVYVDSGSIDDSVARASELGAQVVELDMSRPFTAARARNAGFARLWKVEPALQIVQFVDGDCEIRDGWLAAGEAVLNADSSIAVVCGRLRERYPERSIYNRMCDILWDYPIGEITSCGGIAMFRVSKFAAVGGFNQSLIAGEEFEFCTRLRRQGGRVVRINAEMAWHDVGITRFRQWWMRSVRSGYGNAEGCVLYSPEVGVQHRRRVIRAIAWGMAVPLVFAAGVLLSVFSIAGALLCALMVGLWVANILRLCLRERRRRHTWSESIAFSYFSMIGKVAELWGIAIFIRRRLRSGAHEVIEYRQASS